jgi:hypothetical protein
MVLCRGTLSSVGVLESVCWFWSVLFRQENIPKEMRVIVPTHFDNLCEVRSTAGYQSHPNGGADRENHVMIVGRLHRRC